MLTALLMTLKDEKNIDTDAYKASYEVKVKLITTMYLDKPQLHQVTRLSSIFVWIFQN